MFEEILFRIPLETMTSLRFFNAKGARFFDILGFIKTQKFAKLCVKTLRTLIKGLFSKLKKTLRPLRKPLRSLR